MICWRNIIPVQSGNTALKGLSGEVPWEEWVISCSRVQKEGKGQFLFSLVCWAWYLSLIVMVVVLDQDTERWIGPKLTGFIHKQQVLFKRICFFKNVWDNASGGGGERWGRAVLRVITHQSLPKLPTFRELCDRDDKPTTVSRLVLIF